MTVFQLIRFIIGAILVLSGLFFSVSAVIGNFRFRYVLCRMHAAGLGDTLGLLLVMAGLIVFSGITFFSLKLVLITVLVWTVSPAVSHLIMKMEMDGGSGASSGSEEKE